jgi:Carboxypeptidase regulatory-like domain
MKAFDKNNIACLVVRLFVLRTWTLALLFLAIAYPSEAQVTSVIQGHISDSTGASVPKALVKVTNERTGVSRTAFSAEDGYYRIPDLLAGTYQVRVELSGFKALEKSGIEVSAQSTTNLNLTLEVGEVTQTIEVTGQDTQVETTTARISEVLGENELKSLPSAGRGIYTLTMLTPGIQGKSEGGVGNNFCCDVFSNYNAPQISSGGHENKANYLVDGINLRYTEGSTWGIAFSPNPDAITEVRVSTNPTAADNGTMSGPQVQLVTKGGTNEYHGTGHFTFQQDDLNAVPFGSTREDIPDSYTRLFGGTIGGPIKKERLFFFGAYEGLRERASRPSIVLTETQAFRDFVVSTRPNNISAQLFRDFPPFRYPTSGFQDLDGDGIPEFGEVTLDKAVSRTGKQFNGRIDYQSSSARDRIYGSYWYTRPEWTNPQVRDAFDENLYDRIDYVSVVHTHAFSPNSLNEARFGFTHTHYERVRGNVYHIPDISTDDGFSIGNGPWSREDTPSSVPEFGDVFSLNRGRHGIKLGGTYRHSTWDLRSLLAGDTPQYAFASMLDFADDNPYLEVRGLNAGTGTARSSRLFFPMNELSFFFQNTWQIRPNLTLNYGLRWDSYFNNTLGKGRNNWQPVLTSDQINPDAVSQVINQKIDQYYQTDWNNFGPRISLAWDPTGQGRMSIRAGFSILYDEVNTQPWYAAADNPPDVALVRAGTERGIPTVYGLAPVGTRDFPPNPNLQVPAVNSVGAFDGTRPGLGAIVTDLKNPMIADTNFGIQYQLTNDLMVHATYRYRHTWDELYSFNANRRTGDLADNGLLDLLNPNFDNITLLTNLGRRRYHGLVLGASKRLGQGWQLGASYTYNNAHNNFANGQADNYDSSGTNAYDPNIDWARDDIAHVFTLHGVWDLPFLRGQKGWVAGAFGGWQVNTILNFQSGALFVPLTNSGYGEGGDFNADGQRGERPDRPTGDVAHSFSKDEWLAGPISASLFPFPDTVRAGNLPRDFFSGPGYARVDAAFVKNFPIPIGRSEKGRLQFRAEAFNLFNRINLRDIEGSLDAPNFGRPTSAYQMRTMQLAIKFLF